MAIDDINAVDSDARKELLMQQFDEVEQQAEETPLRRQGVRACDKILKRPAQRYMGVERQHYIGENKRKFHVEKRQADLGRQIDKQELGEGVQRKG